MPDREDLFVGSLLGLALGDALGAPFEGRRPETIRQRVPTASRLLHKPPAITLRYTDDAQMAIAVMEALLTHEEPDAEVYAERYVGNYEYWRGYGRGARTVLSALARGVPVDEAPTIAFPEGSWANGAAMRVAPIGLVFADRLDVLREQTRRSSVPTHCHALAIEGAILVARATAVALEGAGQPFDAGALWDVLTSEVEHDAYRDRIAMARGVKEVDDLFELGTGVAALDSVVTAIACFAMFPDDFVLAVGEAVRLGGDCDTIAAMAGALSGARLGASKLPEAWTERLENGHKGRDYVATGAEYLSRGERLELPGDHRDPPPLDHRGPPPSDHFDLPSDDPEPDEAPVDAPVEQMVLSYMRHDEE